jgi:hypothetical protein
MTRTYRLAALLSAMSVLVVMGTSATPALADNASRCQPYSATANDTATSPAGPFIGIQDVTIAKALYSNVPTVTNVLAPLSPEGASDVLTTTTSHTIALPGGTITTTDDAHLIPTSTPGVYKLVSHLVITSGATGQLQLQGMLNLATLSAEATVVGTVCGLG